METRRGPSRLGQRRARLLVLVSLLEGRQAPLERLFGGVLDVDVERRVDLEATLIHQIRAVPLVQVLADHLHEVGRLLGVVAGLGDPERRLAGLLVGGAVDEFRREHLGEHEVPSPERAVGIPARRIVARVPGQAREQGALRQAQLLDALCEKDLRRGVDAVGALAEVDLVEVHLENLVLGVGLLDPDREDDFLEFAGDGLLVREE